jgi:hypothetical protein
MVTKKLFEILAASLIAAVFLTACASGKSTTLKNQKPSCTARCKTSTMQKAGSGTLNSSVIPSIADRNSRFLSCGVPRRLDEYGFRTLPSDGLSFDTHASPYM